MEERMAVIVAEEKMHPRVPVTDLCQLRYGDNLAVFVKWLLSCTLRHLSRPPRCQTSQEGSVGSNLFALVATIAVLRHQHWHHSMEANCFCICPVSINIDEAVMGIPPPKKKSVKLTQSMIHYFTPFWPNRRSNQSCGTTLGPGVTTLVAPWCCSNLPPPAPP